MAAPNFPDVVSEIGPSKEEILKVDDLSVDYDSGGKKVHALRGVSLTVTETEVLAIVGESGSGKSTLAHSILKYLGKSGTVVSGDIYFKDQSILDASDLELRRIRGGEIAHVAQDANRALNPSLKIGDQIRETIREHKNVSKNEAEEEVVELLERVNIPDPLFIRKKYPHELSGGMQQRVLIAISLASQPKIIIMDEPTTGLDVTTQAKLLDLINELISKYNYTVLLITHDLGVAAETADRIALFYAGELVELGSTKEILGRPAHPYTQGLFGSLPRSDEETEIIPISGKIHDLTSVPKGCIFADRCEFVEEDCRVDRIHDFYVNEDSSHQVKCRRWEYTLTNPLDRKGRRKTDKTKGEAKLLTVEKLVKHYDKPNLFDRILTSKRSVKAVNDVSFDIYEGETLGMVGESGCGKSTVAKLITKLIGEDSGMIRFRGDDIYHLTPQQEKIFRGNCQIVFQNPDSSLNPKKTVGKILERPLKLHTDLEAGERTKKINELLDECRLDEGYRSRYPHELSGGEKQRVAIARAFAPNPSLVVLDEPTSSLDISVQASILKLLKDLQLEYNTSYLLISHNLNLVQYVSDRILVMYLGKIVESGPTRHLFNNPSHPYTQSLIESIPQLAPAKSTEKRYRLEGDVPSMREIPEGCVFYSRCPFAQDICNHEEPTDYPLDPQNHLAKCFRNDSSHEYWNTIE